MESHETRPDEIGDDYLTLIEETFYMSTDKLKSTFGGAAGLLKLFGVDTSTGLTESQVLRQRAKFGRNDVPKPKPPTFLGLLAEESTSSGLAIVLSLHRYRYC